MRSDVPEDRSARWTAGTAPAEDRPINRPAGPHFRPAPPLGDLRQSSQTLRTFADAAASDLQQPLRLVLNYVELLKRRYKSKVDAEGQRLISCVADRAAQVHSTMDEFCRALEHLCQEYMEPAVLASEAQLLVARDIQQKLFPTCAPRLDGYDIAGSSFTAESTGGDYYDYFPMPDDRHGIVVGDVSGHGLGPSLLMIETRAILRSLALSHSDPGEIVTQANRFLAQDTDVSFVTLFLACLDRRRRTITYASAGHRGYLLRWQGQTEVLDSTSLPLGIEEDTVVPSSAEISLEPDDIMLLITDGLIDATSPTGERFGARRILDLVRFLRKEPAVRILDLLYQAITQHTEHRALEDDMTAVVIKAV